MAKMMPANHGCKKEPDITSGVQPITALIEGDRAVLLSSGHFQATSGGAVKDLKNFNRANHRPICDIENVIVIPFTSG